MAYVRSAVGTTIGYDRLSDDGPPLVLVGGGLDDGSENVPLPTAAAASRPNAERVTVEVAGHIADPAVLGPILTEFYLR